MDQSMSSTANATFSAWKILANLLALLAFAVMAGLGFRTIPANPRVGWFAAILFGTMCVVVTLPQPSTGSLNLYLTPFRMNFKNLYSSAETKTLTRTIYIRTLTGRRKIWARRERLKPTAFRLALASSHEPQPLRTC
jgi:hypothetical protein